MSEKEFGEFLQGIRKAKKMTIRQLELYSGVSNAYISQLERGIRGLPSPDILQKLSKPLGVSYEELMKYAGYIEEENQAVKLINNLLLKITDHPNTLKMMKELNSSLTYQELLNEMTLEEKLEVFLAITDDLTNVQISSDQDGNKEIGFGRSSATFDIQDEDLADKINLSYKGMELSKEEKVEFFAILKAIVDARLTSQEKQ